MSPDPGDVMTEMPEFDPWGLRQVEQLLLGLEGVNSVKLVSDGHGGIDEVHVVGAPGVGPKQVVRNIESALLAEFGLQIDHRKISVAQIQAPDISAEETDAVEEPAIPSTPDEIRRLLLDSLELERTAGDRVECRVALSSGDDTYEGAADGPDFARSRLKVAGRAVLDALNAATLDDIELQLEDAERVEACGMTFVVAVVRGQERRNSVTLPGISNVSDSEEEATVLACLQATNRWTAIA